MKTEASVKPEEQLSISAKIKYLADIACADLTFASAHRIQGIPGFFLHWGSFNVRTPYLISINGRLKVLPLKMMHPQWASDCENRISKRACKTYSMNSTCLAQKYLTVGLANNNLPGLLDLDKLYGPDPGFSVEITKLLCETIGYVCKFEISATNEYGSRNSNGTWNGILGQLRNGIYNTSVPHFSMSQTRLEDFSFSAMGISQLYKFYTRGHGNDDDQDKYLSIFKPFSYQVWAALILTVLGISIAAALSLQIRPERCKKVPILIVWTDIFLTLLVYLARKGPKINESRFSTKILLTFWGFTSMALTAPYTCGLLSAMLKSTESLPFHDLKTLANCIDEGKCQMIKTPTGDQFFAEVQLATETSEFFSLKKAFVKNPIINVSKTSEIIEKILDTNDKLVVSWPTFLKLSCQKEAKKKLRFVSFGSRITHFPFRKEDPLKFEFDERMKVLDSTGLFEALNKKDLRKEQVCLQESIPPGNLKAYAIDLRNFLSPFIFLAGGLAVAVWAIGLEHFR